MHRYALSGCLMFGPLAVWLGRDEYKPGIYSDRGQCPALRGEGKTIVF